MTLIEFLQARIAEDEADATRFYKAVTFRASDGYLSIGQESLTDRILAECEAKRHLVEMYEGAVTAQTQIEALGEPPDGGLVLAIARSVVVTAEAAVKLIAEPHADHPDYQQQWQPSR